MPSRSRSRRPIVVPPTTHRQSQRRLQPKRDWLIEELYDQHHGQFFEGEMMGHDIEYGSFAEQFEGMSYWDVKESTEDGEGYSAEFELELSENGTGVHTNRPAPQQLGVVSGA
jgi:hypothetical protein